MHGKARRAPQGRPDAPRSLRGRRRAGPRRRVSIARPEPFQAHGGSPFRGETEGDCKSPLVPASPQDPSRARSVGLRREQNSILLEGPLVSPQPKSPVGLSGSPPSPQARPPGRPAGLVKAEAIVPATPGCCHTPGDKSGPWHQAPSPGHPPGAEAPPSPRGLLTHQ